MQFIDTHIHLQDDKSNNATDIINRARKQGCVKMVCVSSFEEDWEKIVGLKRVFGENIVPAFGIQPWFVGEIKDGWEKRLAQKLEEFPTAVVGECGFDGLKPEPEKQREVFVKQIKLAKKYKRPLIIHAVKAQNEVESLWEELPDTFVVHGYNTKPDFLKKIVRHDGYIGVGMPLLKHRESERIIREIPLNRVLFETDAPYQGIYPWELENLGVRVAEILELSPERVMEQVFQNSLEFIK